jgi:hypothetical protein
MAGQLDLTIARRLLGTDVLGPEEVMQAFGVRSTPPPIPYSATELEAAASNGQALILRIDKDTDGPLTLLRLIERFPEAFDAALLRKTGYQLKDDWGITLEPLASRETAAPGWALVHKEIVETTRNRTYEEQEEALVEYASARGWPADGWRRRSAAEIVYDVLLTFNARGVRSLARTWDWSASRTIDAGCLNVGGFGSKGMQILSYSPAVRHGALGVCPVRVPLRAG